MKKVAYGRDELSMTNSARESFMLKVINLILLPIFIAIIIIYAFEIAYVLEYPEVQTIKEYTQTQQFSDRYMSRIRTIIYNEINKDENNLILENGNSIYFDEINNRFSDVCVTEDGYTIYLNKSESNLDNILLFLINNCGIKTISIEPTNLTSYFNEKE